MLLAVAQSRSLPGAHESCDESHDESCDELPDKSHDESPNESPGASHEESHDESCDESHQGHFISRDTCFSFSVPLNFFFIFWGSVLCLIWDTVYFISHRWCYCHY